MMRPPVPPSLGTAYVCEPCGVMWRSAGHDPQPCWSCSRPTRPGGDTRPFYFTNPSIGPRPPED